MLKKIQKPLIYALLLPLLTVMLGVQAYASAAGAETVVPTGFMAVLTIVPILLVLALLFLKVDMLVAGLAGCVLAMLIGGIGIAEANSQFLATIPQMLSFTAPIINSAIAMAVFKSGSYTAALTLVRRITKGKAAYFCAFIVLLLTAATYMSGIGGGSAMVIAPLAFAAVGAHPELIAAMSVATAVSFTTSPASLESSVASELSGFDVANYVATMRPFWILFVVLAVVMAFIATTKKKVAYKSDEGAEFNDLTNGQLLKITLPAIFLLFAVIFGPVINKAIGFAIFTPLVYMIGTLLLIFLCTKFTLNQSVSSMVEGSNYILTRLFQVGIFLAFINIIAKTGTFEVIAGVARDVPAVIMVPVAVLTGILIGIPAGAYVGTILSLVLPVAVSLNFSMLSIGFITMGVGLGSQLSFVNITMQALSSGFQIPIIDVVKGNGKWVGIASAVLIILAAVLV